MRGCDECRSLIHTGGNGIAFWTELQLQMFTSSQVIAFSQLGTAPCLSIGMESLDTPAIDRCSLISLARTVNYNKIQTRTDEIYDTSMMSHTCTNATQRSLNHAL